MAVLLRVRVGEEDFPIETNLDLQNAVTAIRNPEKRSRKIVIFINQYAFPAAAMNVLESHPVKQSDAAREIESNDEQTFGDDIDEDEYNTFDNAEVFNSDQTRHLEGLNESRNCSFKSKDFYRMRQLEKAGRVGSSGSYYYLTSLRRAFKVLLRAVGSCPFSLVLH